jgi:hypothetical protein
MPSLSWFFAGACGGAGLGLALKSWKRVAALALAGAVGFGVGNLFFFALAFLLGIPLVGAGMGALGGVDIRVGPRRLEEGAASWVGGHGWLRCRGSDRRSLGDVCTGHRLGAAPLVAVGIRAGDGHGWHHRWGIAGSGTRIPGEPQAGPRPKTKSQVNLQDTWNRTGIRPCRLLALLVVWGVWRVLSHVLYPCGPDERANSRLVPRLSYTRLAREANLVYCSIQASWTFPVGPLRCFPMRTSAMPLSSESGL